MPGPDAPSAPEDAAPPGLRPAGRSPGDVSPFGVCDLGGNAAEWTASPFLAYPGSAAPAAEFLADLKVIRGGSWLTPRDRARCAARERGSAFTPYPDVGLRCATDVPDCLADLRGR